MRCAYSERRRTPFDAGNVTAQHEVMALTPAEKQRRYRQRQSALVRSRPDAVEAELLQQFERCERGELGLSDEQRLSSPARSRWPSLERSRLPQHS